MLALACFLISGFFTSLALRLLKFESLCDLEKDVLEKFSKGMSQENFLIDRATDFTVACDRNHSTNNKKAFALRLSMFFILIGYPIQSIFISIFFLAKLLVN